MRASSDAGGHVVFQCFDVLEKFAVLLRNDFVLMAEKIRSLGFLNESLSDVLTDLSANQFPKARELINVIIGSLTQIEYARKVMYHRTHLLADSAFQSSLEQAKTIKGLLHDREQALNRFVQVSAAQGRSQRQNPQIDAKLSTATGTFKAANAQAVQASSVYSNQLHRDLLLTLTSFAHAQMEMHARALEIWGKAIEQIDQCSMDDDNDEASDGLAAAIETIAPLVKD
jgi:hypothetical protein